MKQFHRSAYVGSENAFDENGVALCRRNDQSLIGSGIPLAVEDSPEGGDSHQQEEQTQTA